MYILGNREINIRPHTIQRINKQPIYKRLRRLYPLLFASPVSQDLRANLSSEVPIWDQARPIATIPLGQVFFVQDV